jgi:hypothetical protein
MKIQMNTIRGIFSGFIIVFLSNAINNNLEINFLDNYILSGFISFIILFIVGFPSSILSFTSFYNETVWDILDIFENIIFTIYIISSLIFLDIITVSTFENETLNSIFLINLYTIFGIIIYFFLKFYDQKGEEQIERKLFIEDIESYSGDKKNNKYHGKGVLKFKNDEKYEGQFLNGQFYGFGTYTYGPESISPGEKYEGFFKNGKRSGKGILIHGSDQVLDGYFMNNQANGYGEAKFGNGDIYKGEFKNGKKHGYGTYKFASGEIDKGFYKNDLFVERDDD